MNKLDPITTEERKTIRKAYDNLMSSLKVEISQEDSILIFKAYELAVEAHSRQRRKSGEPYILHPIEVARICAAEIGLGPTAIICALLHDVVEDTEITIKEILDIFGPKIATIVDGLTKLDGTYTKDSPQAENFKKVLSTLIEDVRVVLIKMADRLHNMRTLGSMPRHKQLKIAAETNYIYAPLAHRLGLYAIKTEFQDLCLRITEPETYQELTEKLSASEVERVAYIEEFEQPIKIELEKENIPFTILGRSKSIFSIYNKINQKNVRFEEIYDIFAIRIICDVPFDKEKQTCWQIYSIVTDFYKPIPERLKDWVTTPKSNGYESLHTTVIGPGGRFVEVQIRTQRMDEIAETGFAAHWKYKGLSANPNLYEHWLDNIRSILDSPNTDAIEFLSDFKTNLFSEEVYVYTPSGEMKVLPKGATALDFAFSIHSDVGSQCTAIKANNKLVPLGYKLKNGDRLSVMTSKNQKPSDNWLKLVITGKARSKIRSALKEEKKEKGLLGKEAMLRKLKNMKIDFELNADAIAKHFGCKSRLELYLRIVDEKVDLLTLKSFELKDRLIVFKKPAIVEILQDKVEKIEKEVHPSGSSLLINDEPANQYNFGFANCCKPVNGDKIFGYITTGQGVKVHRTNCPNAMHLMAHYGYRVVKAEWSNQVSTSFVVQLLVRGLDDGPGVINRITETLFKNLEINIRSFNISSDESVFKAKIELLIKNTDQLNYVVNTLQQLKGISTVERIN